MKDYWNFNAAHISLKSDKSSNSPQTLVINGLEVNDKLIIANEFKFVFYKGRCWTSIKFPPNWEDIPLLLRYFYQSIIL